MTAREMPGANSGTPDGPEEKVVRLQHSLRLAAVDLLGRSSRGNSTAQQSGTVSSTSENQRLRARLATARAETNQVKLQWLAVQRAVPTVPLNVQRESELVQTASQLRRVQRDLAVARRTGAENAETAAAAIESLTQQLAAVQQKSFFSTKIVHKLVGAALAAGVMTLLGFLVVPQLKMPHQSVESVAQRQQAGIVAEAQPAALNFAGNRPLTQTSVTPGGLNPSFTQSLSRLNLALASVPGRTAKEVLHDIQKAQVNSSSPACSFAWTEAGPAVLFGKDQKGTDLTSLSTTISKCADAIEQLR